MVKLSLGVCVAVLLGSAAAFAAEELKCGLKKGDSVSPFEVMDVTGEHKGNEVCYRCQFGEDPVICIFTTKMSDKLITACKAIEKRLADNADLKAFVVYCTDDVDAAKKELAEVAKKNELKKLPLTYVKGKGGVEDYKLNKDAETTLVCWKDAKVELTKSYASGKFCDECCGSQVAAFCADIKKSNKGAAN